jgi:hypothetical protein
MKVITVYAFNLILMHLITSLTYFMSDLGLGTSCCMQQHDDAWDREKATSLKQTKRLENFWPTLRGYWQKMGCGEYFWRPPLLRRGQIFEFAPLLVCLWGDHDDSVEIKKTTQKSVEKTSPLSPTLLRWRRRFVEILFRFVKDKIRKIWFRKRIGKVLNNLPEKKDVKTNDNTHHQRFPFLFRSPQHY